MAGLRGDAVSALEDALTAPENAPRPLCEWLTAHLGTSADLSGLGPGGGVVRDFRPGQTDRDPSLSVSVGRAGTVFNRFGGDGFQGGAVAFTADCLGVGKEEAARLLIERAGLTEDAPARQVRRKPPKDRAVTAAHGKLARLKPVKTEDLEAALRGWVPLSREDTGPEAEELARRGLLPAVGGLLTAYRWEGKWGEGKAKKTRRLPRHILPGAVAFAVRGPDGGVWGLKARNPGEKKDLGEGVSRYAYPLAGHSTPAWCCPHVGAAPAHIITEGELNAAACALALEAAGYAPGVSVQGVASVTAAPHVSHLTGGHTVYVYADPDAEGNAARQTWAALAHEAGASVFQLSPGIFGEGDACEALPKVEAEALGQRLAQGMGDAAPWEPVKEEAPAPADILEVWPDERSGFRVIGGRLCAVRLKKDPDTGEEKEVAEPLADFAAFITAEVALEDGTGEGGRVFEVQGFQADGRPFSPSPLRVRASEFGGMNWPLQWGAGAIVRSGQGKKDRAREGIQQLSAARGFTQRTVYQHTGWITHEAHGPLYLTAGAVIGEHGAVSGVEVELPGRLAGYALPAPPEGEALRAAVRESLALLELAPDTVAVPVLGAAYRAPLGRSDFVLWPFGETGRHKTSYLAFGQAHYGAAWNRRHLPDSWNSSANALERVAYLVKDALLPIDDFKPTGSTVDRQRMHGAAARIITGAADGQGRGTLNFNRQARAALYPRGTVMSSAEEIPRQHSTVARLVTVEVAQKLMNTPAMKAAYDRAEDLAAEGVYASALAGYLRFLAGRLEDLRADSPAAARTVRAMTPFFAGEHGRTGPALASLAYGWGAWLAFAVHCGAVDTRQASALWERVCLALSDTAQGQGEHLRGEDPVRRALAVLSGLLAQHRGHLEDLYGGAPEDPQAVGWELRSFGEEERWQPGKVSDLLGFAADGWAYFLPDATYAALQRVMSAQGGAMLPDASTLWRNMRDRLHGRGLMRCTAEKDRAPRPLYKVTGPGGRMNAVALRLPLSDLLGSEDRTEAAPSLPLPDFTPFLAMAAPDLDTAKGEDLTPEDLWEGVTL